MLLIPLLRSLLCKEKLKTLIKSLLLKREIQKMNIRNTENTQKHRKTFQTKQAQKLCALRETFVGFVVKDEPQGVQEHTKKMYYFLNKQAQKSCALCGILVGLVVKR